MTRVKTIYAALAVVALAASCSDGTRPEPVASRATTTTERTTTTSTTVPPPTTTTTVATTTTSTPAGLRQGARGPEVLALEQALAAQRYELGAVDGVYDAMTAHGVMAFQKVHGLARTGRATPDVLAKLPTVGPPGPMMPGGGPNRVEVDLKRQILQLYKAGDLVRVISVSTGNNKRFCVDGECATAVTPGGSYRVQRKIAGIRVSRLGKLWDPVYFNGGIAIHGSPSVPAYPASHGCVRIPIPISKWFAAQTPVGMPVYVLGGKRAPVPFNEPAPGDEATTSTTAPPSSTTTAPTTTTAPPTTTTTTPTSTTSTTTTSTTAASSTTTTTSAVAPATTTPSDDGPRASG